MDLLEKIELVDFDKEVELLKKDLDSCPSKLKLAELVFSDKLPADFPEHVKLLEECYEQKYYPAYSLYATILRDGKYTKGNWEKAKQVLQEGMDQNEPGCFMVMGESYFEGWVEKSDIEKALFYLETASKMGNTQAMIALSKMYEVGIYVKEDHEKSKSLNLKALELKDDDAIFAVGLNHCIGLYGFELDYKKARMFFEVGVKRRSPRCYVELSNIYIKGLGVEKDIQKGLDILIEGVKLGMSRCMNELGENYESGIFGKIDYQKAREYYELGIKRLDGKSCTCLGNMYRYGNGCDINPDKAIEWYQKAINLKDSGGYLNLGILYDSRLKHKKAHEYFNLAYERKNYSSHYQLGKQYYWGRGCQKNKKKYLECIERGFRETHFSSIVEYAYNYLYGLASKKDSKKAIEILELGAQIGDTGSMIELADIYSQKGFKDLYDLEKSKYWIEKACKIDPNAYYTYSDIVERDKKAKVELYFECLEKASREKTDSHYYFCLGTTYQYGKMNIQKDLKKAAENYEIAAKLNNPDALKYLSVFYRYGWAGYKKNRSKAIDLLYKSMSIYNPSAMEELASILGEKYEEIANDYENDNDEEEVQYDDVEADDVLEERRKFQEQETKRKEILYEEGEKLVKKKKEKLKQKILLYYTGAHLFGNSDGSCELSHIYMEGKYDVPVDPNKGFYFLNEHCKRLSGYAMHQKGQVYYYGDGGITSDASKAIKIFEIASTYDYSYSHYFMGLIYLNGSDDGTIQKDLKKAQQHFELAAQDNDIDAVKELIKLTTDEKEQAKWKLMAANLGDYQNNFDIGVAYYNGNNLVEKDLKKAKYYFEKAKVCELYEKSVDPNFNEDLSEEEEEEEEEHEENQSGSETEEKVEEKESDEKDEEVEEVEESEEKKKKQKTLKLDEYLDLLK